MEEDMITTNVGENIVAHGYTTDQIKKMRITVRVFRNVFLCLLIIAICAMIFYHFGLQHIDLMDSLMLIIFIGLPVLMIFLQNCVFPIILLDSLLLGSQPKLTLAIPIVILGIAELGIGLYSITGISIPLFSIPLIAMGLISIISLIIVWRTKPPVKIASILWIILSILLGIFSIITYLMSF